MTVGAAHDDAGGDHKGPHLDLVPDGPVPAPYGPLGPGFRRSIKPDVLLPGGRQLYRRPVIGSASPARYNPVATERPPGILAAVPGPTGSVAALGCSRGTSNAAVLASRAASFAISELQTLSGDDSSRIDSRYFAAHGRALVVHAAEWGAAEQMLRDALDIDTERSRDHLARLLGYGIVDPQLVARSATNRATLVGTGSISDREKQTFRLPLPAVLRASTDWRRLTITLAWFSPIACNNRLHRVARLWAEPPTSDLRLYRQQAEWRAVKRGTVQHEILEGTQAAVFEEDGALAIDVSCRSDIGRLDRPVPFGLAVSLQGK